MGYLKDAMGMLLLERESFRRVGNNPGSTRRFVTVYISLFYMAYVIVGLLMAVVGMDLLFRLMQKPLFWVLAVGAFLLPFILLLFMYIGGLIPYAAGKVLKGEARKYKDFFAVWYYTIPLVMVLEIPFIVVFEALGFKLLSYFFSMVISIYMILIHFKTFRIIHKLSVGRSVAAYALTALISLLIISVLALLFALLYFASVVR